MWTMLVTHPSGEREEPVSVVQVTQTDVNAGRVVKQASISGKAVNGDEVDGTVDTVVGLPQDPAITVGESQPSGHKNIAISFHNIRR